MDKSSLRFRFEQRRGHYLVVEGTEDRPLTRQDCDEFQLRMLAVCEVPGLLKLEAEEIDGRLSLRYALTGTRMLTQVTRANKMTMAAYMGALCRLAEVMEDCRLYVLNPGFLLLDDDRIFVGQAGDQDLKFVYLPIKAEEAGSVHGMESLIVRWMMQVANPDGKAIQQTLRIAASPEFKPASLSRFARAYMAGDHPAAHDITDTSAGIGVATEGSEQGNHKRAAYGFAAGSWDAVAATDIAKNNGRQSESGHGFAGDSASSGRQIRGASADASGRWRWFQPVSNDANSMSSLLGDDSDPYGEAPEAPVASSSDGGRRQVVLLCAAFGVIAIAWRWGYAVSPDNAGLSLSLGVTVAVLAAAGWLSISFRRAELRGNRPKRLHQSRIQLSDESPKAASAPDGSAGRSSANDGDRGIAAKIRAREDRGAATELGQSGEAEPLHTGAGIGEAPWEEDRTQFLESHPNNPGSKESSIYYLAWESETQAPPIPLNGASLIIGRSREASGHVDVTPGISRAHMELLHTGEGWAATDLGSRNGSKLNGAAMVAYESYPLQPDDAIELAGAAVYRLKYGKPQQQAS